MDLYRRVYRFAASFALSTLPCTAHGPHHWPRLCWQIIAFRRGYFLDPWNRFDFFIVIGSTLGLLMLWFTGSTYGSIATIVRIFRIGRILRLVRGLDSMTRLFNTLLVTLPSLANVGALLILLFFIYAAMGVQLFAKVWTCGRSFSYLPIVQKLESNPSPNKLVHILLIRACCSPYMLNKTRVYNLVSIFCRRKYALHPFNAKVLMRPPPSLPSRSSRYRMRNVSQVELQGAVSNQANFQHFGETMVLLLRFSTGDNWNHFMYDMATSRENCVADPDYDPDMCGFSNNPGCIPLNGCGSWAIYPFMIRCKY